MLFDYDTENLTSNARPKLSFTQSRPRYSDQNTKIQVEGNSDYVALSPIGPWFLSVSPAYNPGVNTSGVNEVCLQLGYTFLPCADPQCPPRGRKVEAAIVETNLTKAEGYKQKSVHAPNAQGPSNAVVAAATTAAVVLVVLLALAVVVIWRRKTRQRSQREVSELTRLIQNPSVQT